MRNSANTSVPLSSAMRTISTSRPRTVALHEHNERATAAKLLRVMHAGKNVALISDAGTPALSDPAALLVEQAHRAGIRVIPIPGPSAAVAAFSASGFPAARFLFAGFLPAGRSARRKALEGLELPWPVILYEAPHRVLETLADLAERFGAAREVVIARELTKKFEDVARLALGEARDWLLANPKPPVRTTQQALEYRERILRALPPRTAFEPLMTLYLTDDTPPEEIALAKRSGQVFGVKLYPASATTHSDEGVTRLSRCFHALEKMTEIGMPLLIHGESTDPAIDVFDREKAFIEEVLGPLVERFPQLKVVLEHITTRDAVQYIEVTGPNIAATITAHHLLMNRNALFMGGIRPHHYCLPVLKREDHREALVEAAASGNPKFFLGTDSAPHGRHAKETACGCAGIYTAHAAIEFYAIAFEEAGALGKLEGFASVFGPQFYGLPLNRESITLVREEWKAPAHLEFGGEELVPLRAGETIPWKLL